ncbi:hypothetical protein C7293_24705 [filamentous cyanobacterium CCT1]|nr:hypothetical protein C7293_24705 [filamentous cyanobacterium CCT1]PSN78147.1 hypothetical protein C8B47_18365 [filamentous cyanobacterium CCP4]
MTHQFQRRLQRLALMALGLLTAGLVWFKPAPQAATEPWIPTVPVQWDEQYARVPDWSQLTFDNLPPLLSGRANAYSPSPSEDFGEISVIPASFKAFRLLANLG